MADGRSGLLDLLKTHAKEARIGGTLGFTGSFSFLFIDATHGNPGFWDLVVKLLFMCISTACTAVIGAWSKDIYDNFKANRKKKDKDYGQRKTKQPAKSGGSKAA